MVAALEKADKARDSGEEGAEEAWDEVKQIIYEDPLSVEIRSAWHAPGCEASVGGEFRILLCTGGPAVQITGELNEHMEPESAGIEYQDWFTPWTPLQINGEEGEALLQYAQCFYYGG